MAMTLRYFERYPHLSVGTNLDLIGRRRFSQVLQQDTGDRVPLPLLPVLLIVDIPPLFEMVDREPTLT